MIHKERIEYLNSKTIQKGDYILYWIQASPRSHYNHALEYAIEKANELKKPLVTYFGISKDFPNANYRHYYFLIQGLKETALSLKKRNIHMVLLQENPAKGAIELSKNAVLTITDRGYLKIQREWREKVASAIECPLIQVETNVIVPVQTASPKEEYSAGTIRKKIQRELDYFMVPVQERSLEKNSLDFDLKTNSKLDSKKFDLENLKKSVKKLKLKDNVGPSIFQGGTKNALQIFHSFIENKLDKFEDLRNDPSEDYLSNMSPYLHFGQISPLYLALEVSKIESPGKDSFLEELIIRRELSMNLAHYNDNYDRFDCLPNWAKKTLLEHQNDIREYSYTLEELETAKTHDPYWNAAQREMVITGKMHGYMRMYWGKKILEWTNDPRNAYDIAVYLNDKYEIDGRDPNGYTGVAWCFGKHDRAWKEREIFGKVRYMNANGLKRKFKIEKYVDRINQLEQN
ncbi:MAG: deoxyribodipyrimidine photo-lyase [Methanobacteriaceae archaeon]|nr:deoxyribodipyrimidine photo-lyase [Methanobacteriaceae archaeon]MDP3624105.1 deoxyribodipyrimidine photo-lyase [Methanobacteriaceae archaeon]